MNIVLYRPQIPPNTGNIARTCAVTGIKLHLIKPLSFDIDDKSVKRAGLDYWDDLDLEVHNSFENFIFKYASTAPMYFCSTHGERLYSEINYDENSFLIFGQEQKGLSPNIYETYREYLIRIPLLPIEGARSLNLSNAAAIVAYEALRQQSFKGLI